MTNRYRLAVLQAIAVLPVVLNAAGCGSGGGEELPPPPPPPPAPMSVTQTVGAGGGTINGPNGVTVVIPPDALASATQITIALDATGAPQLPPSGQAIGQMVSLTPHGTTFSVPVTVSVPFDPALLPAGQQVTLIKSNRTGDAWQQLVTQRDGNTLTAAATSFSWVGVRCCLDPVHISDQPDDQTAFEGGFAFFRVDAFGFSPNDDGVRFQWFRNGLPMPGETNPEILIPRVTLAHDNSLYMARVTGFGGLFEDSRAARLLVTPIAPVIVNQPRDAQVVAGQTAGFSAASTSSVAQVLQWQRGDGTSFSDIGGETGTVLSIVAQPSDDGARFRMCASNTAGTTCSRDALLSVIPQPTQPLVTQQPQSVLVATGSSANFTVAATGGGLSYEWQRADDGVTFAPVSGATSATYTISNAQLTDDGSVFRVRVFNSVGSTLSAEAQLEVRLNPGAVLTRVGGGGGFSMGLRGNGSLRAWGVNTNGQLGDGTTDTRNDAVDVVGLTEVATLSVGSHYTLAIRANGEVWGWGRNRDGQLGDGTTIDRATPQPVPGLGPARSVAASLEPVRSFSLAVLADGTVRAWGNNAFGQLGDGTIASRPAPVQVGNLSEMVSVAAGSRHALALRRDGTVWAWGANSFGQLGDGTTTASLAPVPVPTPAAVVDIAAGGLHSLALTDQGTVLAWGFNISGGLGDGTTEHRSAPVTVQLPAPAIAISASWDGHSMALLADGRVYAWGYNEYGQCGFGTDTPEEPVPRPVVSPLPPDIVAIGTGSNHSLALDVGGVIWAWGSNSGNALNDGSAAGQREAPVPVLNVNLN